MSLVVLFVAIVIVIFVLRSYLRYKRIANLLEKVPSPPGLPVVGNILEFADPTKILQQFLKNINAYGPIVKLWALWYPSILITDYKYVEEVLSTSKILYKSVEYSYFDRWLGSGLLTSTPDKWKKTRKIITPTFHFQILEQFIDIFDSCTDILIDKLSSEVGNAKVNIYDYVTLCALDVICESAMGTKVDAQINSESKYITSVKEMSRVIRGRMFSPIKMLNVFYYCSLDYRKERAALKVLHDYTTSVIQKRRELTKTISENGTKEKKRLAFLDLLLQSTLDGRPMTDYEIRQEVDTFMFEGHDTTASAVSSTLYCLSHNPDVQVKAVNELSEIFGSDKKRPPTHQDLQNMKYLEMVIKEALRLYPPVPFYARKVVEDTEFGNIILPKDVTVNIFAWGLHRNPEFYPDPEKFDPERFTLENQSKRGPFSYIPFSAGPRNCIGQRFAMLEMKSTVSKILRNFEILPVPDFEPVWIPDIIMKPQRGIYVRLRERMF